ncbi:MAG: ABC transporter ATP-binding protein/permease [Defluviitaleaceae bacterium]|nr:ABC transporter ATP-binding protein/permease [Defluviitaleaceae bacterium]
MSRFHTGNERLTLKQALAYNRRAIKILHKVRPGVLVIDCINSAIEAINPLVVLFLSSLVISELSGGREVSRIVFYVALAVGSGFLFSAASNILWYVRTKIGGNDFWECMLMMFEEKHSSMDFANVEDAEVAALRADIQAKIDANAQGLMKIVYTGPFLFGRVVSFIGAAVILSGMFFIPPGETFAQSHFILVLLIIASIMVPGVVTVVLTKRSHELIQSIMANVAKYNILWQYYAKTYTQTPDGGMDVRVFKLAGPILRAIEKSQTWFMKGYEKADSMFFGINAAVGVIFTVLAFLIIGLRALDGMYDIGEVTRFVGAVTAFSTSVVAIIGQSAILHRNAPNLGQVFDYVDLKQHAATAGGRKLSDETEIKFHNVSFKYPKTDRFALKNINITFARGERLAVVGMNGSGKTTMIKLLCRLYEPTEGHITLNGININEYDYEEYLKTFAVVFQEFFLMSMPIGQNLATNLEYDTGLAISALEKAGFGERLKELEHGLETLLYKHTDESGVNISGGEAQKIALARAIYKNAPFVVLDEPTAALDPIAEFEVYSKFNDLIGEKTAVFVSHRLSSCRFCHRIAVFHEGRIIQHGTHEGLLAENNGKYHEMWCAQAQYYE